MSRIVAFAYGSASYVIFLATFLYVIGFIGNFRVPKSLDSPAADPWTTALTIDLGLLSLFAVQHSVMARRGFKSLLTRVVPPAVERSTYVLASSLALLLLFWQWRPIGGVVGMSKIRLAGPYCMGGSPSVGCLSWPRHS
jgi:protein-S-isoprenylcysteine O-methyltransferase Ste14